MWIPLILFFNIYATFFINILWGTDQERIICRELVIFDTYNVESFFGGGGGGRFTLMEDILKVNARLIPSIYFLVVYTRTKKPQRSKRSPQPGYFYMCLKDRSNSSLLKQKTPGIFNWKTSMYNRIPRAANSGFLPSRRISLPWSVTSFKSTK